MKKGIFAAGCFWGVEAAFRAVSGVSAVTVGYTGGSTENPSYEDVSTGATGHAEAVEVSYDSAKVSYEDLLGIFWTIHDPTAANRQGLDVGSQYRSAIFYLDEQQRAAALHSKDELEHSGRFKRAIVTEIIPAAAFYPAEEYHQRYFERHDLRG